MAWLAASSPVTRPVKSGSFCWCCVRVGLPLLAEERVSIIEASPGTDFALLQIKQPKTRGRAARHHAARVDPPDIIELLDLAFVRYRPEQKLWPLSDGAFRRRFVTIQKRLQLTSKGEAHFDLSSFRPGGATWMLSLTENPDLVRNPDLVTCEEEGFLRSIFKKFKLLHFCLRSLKRPAKIWNCWLCRSALFFFERSFSSSAIFFRQLGFIYGDPPHALSQRRFWACVVVSGSESLADLLVAFDSFSLRLVFLLIWAYGVAAGCMVRTSSPDRNN